MTGEVFTNRIFPENERIILVPETSTPGVPGSAGILDSFTSCGGMITHQILEVYERFGYAQTLMDRVETVHEADVNWAGRLHINGLFPYALGMISGSTAGGGADTITGTVSPFAHAVAVGTGSNRVSTASIYWDTGDANWMQFGQATCYEATVQWAQEGEASCTAKWKTLFPQTSAGLYAGQTGEVVFVAPPSGASLKQVGKDYTAAPALGVAVNYQLAKADGTFYNNAVLGGQLSITRSVKCKYGTNPVQANYAAATQGQKNPIDILVGETIIKGTLDVAHDGIGSHTMYVDSLVFGKRGTSASPQKLKFLDGNGGILEFVMWPLTFDPSSLKDDGFRVGSMPFTVNNDRNTLLTSGVATALTTNITNAVNAPYIW